MIYLTESEAALIVDALNGVIIDSTLAKQILWQEVKNAICLDHLDARWYVDSDALTAKLKKITNADALRIVKLSNLARCALPQSTFAALRAIGLANAVSNDELLTPTASAALCSKSLSALGQLAAKGKLNAFVDPIERNPRRQTRYRKSEILALLRT